MKLYEGQFPTYTNDSKRYRKRNKTAAAERNGSWTLKGRSLMKKDSHIVLPVIFLSKNYPKVFFIV